LPCLFGISSGEIFIHPINLRTKFQLLILGYVGYTDGSKTSTLRIQKSVKKETEIGFPDYMEKAETGAIGRALAMCGYGTLQAPEFDEQDRLADAPVEKQESKN
jgi:hypothetical protein